MSHASFASYMFPPRARVPEQDFERRYRTLVAQSRSARAPAGRAIHRPPMRPATKEKSFRAQCAGAFFATGPGFRLGDKECGSIQSNTNARFPEQHAQTMQGCFCLSFEFRFRFILASLGFLFGRTHQAACKQPLTYTSEKKRRPGEVPLQRIAVWAQQRAQESKERIPLGFCCRPLRSETNTVSGASHQ